MPLQITQPNDPLLIIIIKNQSQWQNCLLRVSFNYREGMMLHAVMYNDHGRIRSDRPPHIIHRYGGTVPRSLG
ncbi:hypothetical protein DIJ64_07760 [Mycobacterium leprae]|uniref:Uncharacterized protein n=1 Tax=Mycobacterium leprae TaxID=1769 RepID=A0AAD0KWH8_MYCLR|nr:hypothetical protein DIJ64_07760 [Mycobacterium leprae]OAR19802.1 hypothetical protein A8144_03920 [Mycobacterium leprae 3125609]OAX71916.1 hypothetical protein A3216_02960 [Mycobacterium leprae 7935681]